MSGEPASVGQASSGPVNGPENGPAKGEADGRPSLTVPLGQGSFASAFKAWSQQASTSRKLAYSLAIAAVVSCLVTASVLLAETAEEKDVRTTLGLIYLNGILLLLLGVVVARRVVGMWLERRRGQAGSGLHVRLALLFSLVATAPAILVSIFSAVFLNYGLQAWFGDSVTGALDRSLVVSKAYLKEHRENFGADVVAIANDLTFNAAFLSQHRDRMGRALTAHVNERGLTEALIVDGQGNVLARPQFSVAGASIVLPDDGLKAANAGQMAIIPADTEDRIRAMVKLNAYLDTFLVVERFVDPTVLIHIDRIQRAVSEYNRLAEEQGGIQITFVLIFVIVTVLLLLAAVWTGLTVSSQLARPVSQLIEAAERVRDGDLDVRVDPSEADDEISVLGRTFNRMTGQIRAQQEGLMTANRELDERRRFTEAVLAGVSAGVIGLDKDGRITLPNRSARELLKCDLDGAIGERLDTVVPEMAGLVSDALDQPYRTHRSEIRLMREGQPIILLARVASEQLAGELLGYIVTFDDITELQSAQRIAAWADVARRIAHEIKNPLTPIQLSAERLKRKYQSEIQQDPETFLTCTETIIRQVEDIGRMVDEFSSFARMPEPSMAEENLSRLAREVFSLEETRHPDIAYALELPDEDVKLRCDRRQVSRALTNIIKNATESIESALETRSDPEGKLIVSVAKVAASDSHDGEVWISVVDNGKGLPTENRERLTEPYVTTREKGTGLGLAIVRKIMEDHNGRLIMADRPDGGAVVSLAFKVSDGQDAAGSRALAGEREADPMAVATGLVTGKL